MHPTLRSRGCGDNSAQRLAAASGATAARALPSHPPAPPCLPAYLQSFSTTDILQTLAIAVLAGLFWLGTGWDDTLLGCAAPAAVPCLCTCQLPQFRPARRPSGTHTHTPLHPPCSARDTLGLLFFMLSE